MMKLNTILKMLLKEHHLSESELARRTGIGQPVIHRMASGETDNPKVATLIPIARYFALTINQLMGVDPLPKDRIPGTYNPIVQTWAKVPLFTWEQLTEWPNITRRGTHDIRISTDADVSEQAFAIYVKDSTMLPRFPEGTLLIIDPALEAQDKDFVIAIPKAQKNASFKQLLIDGDDIYLKPINPDFNTLQIDSETKVVGVMIQARMDFRKSDSSSAQITISSAADKKNLKKELV